MKDFSIQALYPENDKSMSDTRAKNYFIAKVIVTLILAIFGIFALFRLPSILEGKNINVSVSITNVQEQLQSEEKNKFILD